MTTIQYIQLIAAGIMVLAMIGIFVERLISGRGIGARVIQFLAVSLVVPTILILSLAGMLSTEITATLLGTMIGYLLSGIGDYKPEKKDKDPRVDKPK